MDPVEYSKIRCQMAKSDANLLILGFFGGCLVSWGLEGVVWLRPQSCSSNYHQNHAALLSWKPRRNRSKRIHSQTDQKPAGTERGVLAQ